MSETNLIQLIRLEANKHGCFLSRNNTGSLQNKTGRWVKFGLFNPGGSDLIGFRKINNIAQFVAIEVKIQHGRIRPEQQEFIDFINKNGGLAGIVRSVEDFKKLVAIKN